MREKERENLIFSPSFYMHGFKNHTKFKSVWVCRSIDRNIVNAPWSNYIFHQILYKVHLKRRIYNTIVHSSLSYFLSIFHDVHS